MSFDPAASFLLDLHYDNLYERQPSGVSVARPWRCIGCGESVGFGDAKRAHYEMHRSERENARDDAAKQRSQAASERMTELHRSEGKRVGRPRQFPHEDAISRFNAGESISAIAKSYGVTAPAVRRVVKPRRDPQATAAG